MNEIQVRQIVEKDGEVILTGLPYKKGQSIEVTVSMHPEALTVGRLRQSGLIGMWQDREDIGDSAVFARNLRAETQQRWTAQPSTVTSS